MDWCRNVGEKHKTIFGENRLRKLKTSDFFDRNIGTFDAKHPYFLSKKSDVLQLPEGSLSPLQKKFFKKIPTFPTPRNQIFFVY